MLLLIIFLTVHFTKRLSLLGSKDYKSEVYGQPCMGTRPRKHRGTGRKIPGERESHGQIACIRIYVNQDVLYVDS